jgi:hypothetical protein
MKPILAMHLSPRCSARSKRTKQQCRAPAVSGWTACRFHGAGGGGPRGSRNGAYRSGLFTKEAVEEGRSLQELVRQSRKHLFSIPTI